MPNRKARLLDRLRRKLRDKRSTLADEFDFKMYILFVFKDPTQEPLIFEAEKVALWMTNNAERDLVGRSQEVKDLITRDTVQIHAMRWFALNSNKMDPVKNMDFTVWPNPKDSISCIEALCFSRWKGSKKNKNPYKLLSQRFVLRYYEIRRHVRECVLPSGKQPNTNKRREIVFNPTLNFAIWLSKHNGPRGIEARLTSVMLCVPQAELTKWTPGAQFVNCINFDRVAQFQMILWKDLASRARQKRSEAKVDLKSGLVADGLDDRTAP
eukprot:CAMPEP_0167807136 /NCGR_PEP_ID=MMETSP0111_2-20121227/22321_1 /TAXON_ID=91324 /ORGANISM="Lotharella globosa, Strain CCCM811" /LENGTH=267 /DNA_ID=CAMNT_0007704877 /DNA_START=86 /DNA_END=886 /DNA_ORIENTATION=+